MRASKVWRRQSERADATLRHTESAVFRIEHAVLALEYLPAIVLGIHLAHGVILALTLAAVLGIVLLAIGWIISHII